VAEAGGLTSRLRRPFVALVVATATGVVLVSAAAAPTGCAGNDCQADTQTFPKCGGERIGTDVWESGPITGTYLDFHGERTWVFNPSGWMGNREPYLVNAYESLDPNVPADGGGSFAEPAGNLGEVIPVKVGDGWQVQLLNDTCAQYYLRVVLTYAPETGSGAASTGACVTGAEASDAGTD
jgi:hypothetical protein